ncbi:hypothetical protein [Cytobacillus oceanisediminis]|uniref:hypothetical protein n=1 Tax=Cytobacillus oceanisediminis TaxID=665099 RepID=UPI001C2374C8|nr:hypothetical protein [Cytobacillus oceanisediminis]MBU8773199.1 hypothetical protein [Cytobacillus oceanisediminis]
MQSLIEGFFIGIISGCVSSYIVYLITKSRESKALKNSELKDFAQILSRYLRILAFELEHSMEENGFGEIKHLKRELIDPPRLTHNKHNELSKDITETIQSTYILLGELESEIDSNKSIPNTRLLRFRSQLVQKAIEILRVA